MSWQMSLGETKLRIAFITLLKSLSFENEDFECAFLRQFVPKKLVKKNKNSFGFIYLDPPVLLQAKPPPKDVTC